MKKLFSVIACIGALYFAGGLTSCKKDSKNDPVCRIGTISETDMSGPSPSTTLLSLSYDESGRISKLVAAGAGNFSKIFTYSGNAVHIVQSDAGGPQYVWDISLNNNGYPLTITEKDKLGAVLSTVTMEYTGNTLSRIISIYTPGTEDTTTYNFSGGNMTNTSDGVLATYYTDKSYQQGDYLKLIQIVNYGVEYIRNKNLIKSIVSGTDTENFTYEFDNTGKVTKLTLATGTSNISYDYTYSCN
jgi:hypothetical protein